MYLVFSKRHTTYMLHDRLRDSLRQQGHIILGVSDEHLFVVQINHQKIAQDVVCLVLHHFLEKVAMYSNHKRHWRASECKQALQMIPILNLTCPSLLRSLSIHLLSVLVCVCLSVYLSVYLSNYLSVYLSNYLSVYLSNSLSVYLFVYLSNYLSVHLNFLSASLFVFLSLFLSVFLPVCVCLYERVHVCQHVYSLTISASIPTQGKKILCSHLVRMLTLLKIGIYTCSHRSGCSIAMMVLMHLDRMDRELETNSTLRSKRTATQTWNRILAGIERARTSKNISWKQPSRTLGFEKAMESP